MKRGRGLILLLRCAAFLSLINFAYSDGFLCTVISDCDYYGCRLARQSYDILLSFDSSSMHFALPGTLDGDT